MLISICPDEESCSDTSRHKHSQTQISTQTCTDTVTDTDMDTALTDRHTQADAQEIVYPHIGEYSNLISIDIYPHSTV